MDGAGLALGAAGALLEEVLLDAGAALLLEAGVAGFAGCSVSEPSPTLVLENISCRLHVRHRVCWFAPDANLVVQMGTCTTTCVPHATDSITP